MFGLVSSCLDVQSYWTANSWAALSVFDCSARSKGLKCGHLVDIFDLEGVLLYYCLVSDC